MIAACLFGGFGWGQEAQRTVITESEYVSLIPDNSQGYLVFDSHIAGVDHWTVEVFEHIEGVETLIGEYETESSMNHVKLSPAHYQDADNTIRISGIDVEGYTIVDETHELAIGDGPPSNPLDCHFLCIGADYAWDIGARELTGTPLQSLKLGQAHSTPATANTPAVYFFENIAATNMPRFYTEASARGVILGANGPHYGVKWMGPLTVQPGQLVVNFQGNPIAWGDSYYKLYKDMGDWRWDSGKSTGYDTPYVGSSYCLYTFDGIIDRMNTDVDVLLDTELECVGDNFQLAGVLTWDGTSTSDIIDCLMGLPIFPDAGDFGDPDVYLASLGSYSSAVDDCYGIAGGVGGDDGGIGTILPHFELMFVKPVDVEGDAPDLLEYSFVEGGGEEDFDALEDLPNGLYMVGVLLEDGTYVYTYQEKTPAEEVVLDFDFSMSPNPVAYEEEFTVTLTAEIEGDAHVEVFDIVTGALILEGAVSNGDPFVGAIPAGRNRSFSVHVFTDTESISHNLIAE